jgi:hypothetical protein
MAVDTSIMLTAFLLVIQSTRVNVGVSPDSVNYLHAAKSLASGKGLMMLGQHGSAVPLTHFPPLFPIALAVPSSVGRDPMVSGRWLNAFLYAVSAGLVMALVRRHGAHAWAVRCAGAMFVALRAVLPQHVMLWSEPLFLTLTLLFANCIVAHLISGHIGWAIAAGALAGAAFLTRYVGASVVAAGGIICLLAASSDMRPKWKHVIAFATAALVGPTVWLARNATVGGTLTNRSPAYHPPSLGQLAEAVRSVCAMAPVPSRLEPFSVLAIPLALGILALGSYLLLARRGTEDLRFPQRCPVLLALLTTVVSYLLVLLVSVSFFDAAIPLGRRLLGQAVALLVPAFVIAYLRLFRSVRSPILRAVLFVVVPALLLIAGAHRTAREVLAWSKNGVSGYTDPTWNRSACVAECRKLGAKVIIYTNGVEIVYLYTGQYANLIPAKYAPNTGRPNPMYGEQLAAMIRHVANGNAVVLWFDRLERRKYLATRKELADLLPDRVTELPDGVLFGWPLRPTVRATSPAGGDARLISYPAR